MAAILVMLACFAALAGFFFLSEATTGVGILAIGCFLGILARIAQADAQQKELRQLLSEKRESVTPQVTEVKEPVQTP